MKEKIEYIIYAGAELRQEKTFFVSSVCDSLCLEHDLSLEYTFLVFLVMISPQGKIRFQKQLSYSEPVIQIGPGPEQTTIGGIPGKIEAGEWKLGVLVFPGQAEHFLGDRKVAFTVSISNQTFPVREVIGGPVWADENFHYTKYDFGRVYQTGARWYRGDFHTHTRLSDGKELPQSASQKSEKAELDFYVPTEHNVLHTGWPKTSLMIVPGVEITTLSGHANLFGIDKMPAALEQMALGHDMTDEVLFWKSILLECRQRGWLFSVNHPFLSVWKWLWDEISLSDMDCIEIINDPTYAADPQADAETANRQAVLFADLLWEDGYRICAIGGSDSHNYENEWYPGADGPSIPGDPSTFLYMQDLTPQNLTLALRNCQCYVSRCCQVKSNIMFGSILPQGTQEMQYEIVLSETKVRPVLFYIYNSVKYLCDLTESGQRTYTAQGTIPMTDCAYHWIRFGAETEAGDFLFYGNAVTMGTKEHTTSDFKKMKAKLEKQWRSKEYYLTKMEP